MTRPARRRRPQAVRPAGSGIAAALHGAREGKGLSQEELAASLGLHQRQISDLERAKVDSRLSTIQNVARALDLELVLIPRQLIPAVKSLQRSESTSMADRPLYSLDEEDSTIAPPGRSKDPK
jgi:transcriptional regulator with XRE-family HTH domain